MEPPPKRRFRTQKIFIPSPDRPLDQVRREFLSVRDQLREQLRAADGLDLKRAKVQSPALRFLRMPLGAYFAMILAHDRRHLWQARQVRTAPAFP